MFRVLLTPPEFCLFVRLRNPLTASCFLIASVNWVSVKPGTHPVQPETAWHNPGTPLEHPIIPLTSHNAPEYPQYSQEHS